MFGKRVSGFLLLPKDYNSELPTNWTQLCEFIL
jgi:hypothetical protein